MFAAKPVPFFTICDGACRLFRVCGRHLWCRFSGLVGRPVHDAPAVPIARKPAVESASLGAYDEESIQVFIVSDPEAEALAVAGFLARWACDDRI